MTCKRGIKMRKILANITNEEKEKCRELESIYFTFGTLLKIERYHMEQEDIKKKMIDVRIELDKFWFDILEKYHLPVYVDKDIKLDPDNMCLYLDE
jgi:hypothetical protein